MIKKLLLKFICNIQYDRKKKKMIKIYKDSKGNLYRGYSKLSASLWKENKNLF